MKKNRLTAKDMAWCGIGAALTAISAWISIPMPQVSFTMQSFAVFFLLGLLGGRLGCVSIGIYLLMGLIGLPVFSGFRGGVGILFGVTGGYIWGFLAAGLVYWSLTALLGRGFPVRLWGMILGMILCYACGTAWYLHLYGGSFWPVFATCVVPFLLPDGVKLALAFSLSDKIKPFVRT